MKFKLPVSVLVLVHTVQREVLLLERALRPGYWQSVTGSLDTMDELLERAAAREVREETGIDAARGRLERWNVVYTFEIYKQWRHRFAPGVKPPRAARKFKRRERCLHVGKNCQKSAARESTDQGSQ